MAPRTSEPFEEALQVRGFRIPREASQVMKHAVGTQRLGGFDSPQAQNLRVGQSIQRFADTVAVVSLSESDLPPERARQLEALEEGLKQSRSAELSQADPVGSHSQISRSPAHYCRTTFAMRLRNECQDSHLRGFRQEFVAIFWSSSRRIRDKSKLTPGIRFAVIAPLRIHRFDSMTPGHRMRVLVVTVIVI